MSRLYFVLFWLILTIIIWQIWEPNLGAAVGLGLMVIGAVLAVPSFIALILQLFGHNDNLLYYLMIFPGRCLAYPDSFKQTKKFSAIINGNTVMIVATEIDDGDYSVYLESNPEITGSGSDLEVAVEDMVQNNLNQFPLPS